MSRHVCPRCQGPWDCADDDVCIEPQEMPCGICAPGMTNHSIRVAVTPAAPREPSPASIEAAIRELDAALEPLLDNAEGYDKSNVRAAFLAVSAVLYPESRRRELLDLEEAARIAWKKVRLCLADHPTPEGSPHE